MTDKNDNLWSDAPEVEDVEYISEDGKKYLVREKVRFEIVAGEYQKESQFGPRYVFTIANEKDEERLLSMSDKDPNMGRNKVNRWILDILESGRADRIPAMLVKKGRAYSFADPDAIPF